MNMIEICNKELVTYNINESKTSVRVTVMEGGCIHAVRENRNYGCTIAIISPKQLHQLLEFIGVANQVHREGIPDGQGNRVHKELTQLIDGYQRACDRMEENGLGAFVY